MFKKALFLILLVSALAFAGYMAFINYVPYSTGIRSGELIKISKKGTVFKTWEGEMSQGISGAQIFKFSVMQSDAAVLEKLQNLQGHYVVVGYEEKYRTFKWWGDTRYFIKSVKEEKSPFKVK
ncbi:6-phosphogluconate dehydrogenase [Flavobacterium agrisoli]|uniref:6-phosphogluconate dehydrogenase n=1 Tax=Flavobacterium agrisoli TaxID=2793066 RepID=A0A934UKL3_9FLAO|nr:6-phosphogluconate dehydrogenase [Flavobacterium agrisoli]MBK0371221.1 6-phosphogluconate dehydrogenase [Flavobacterium agrisoli]